jgi:tRNA (mo5U34)-methyltransferase
MLHLPESLAGKTVLDIGAWDGFYSFEAERRGAARVLATDSFSWGGPGWGSKAGFGLARRALGSSVQDQHIDVLDLSPERVGTFDVVLFLGVLYHMRHPMLALEKVFSVTRGMAIVETHAVFRGRHPMMEFYPGTELVGDPTNWFGPNPSAVEGMLRAAGFSRAVKVFAGPSFPQRILHAAREMVTGGRSFFRSLDHGRVVYHAYR